MPYSARAKRLHSSCRYKTRCAASVLVCPSALLPAVWKVATASFATENAYFAMTQEGATLQNYNNELVACIEEVR